MWLYDLTGSLAHAGGAFGVGPPTWDPGYLDGRYHHGDSEFVNAMNVWIGMRKDGSVLPGDMGMDDEQAKMLFAINKAGLQFGFWWNPGNYVAYNSKVDFGLVFAPPTPDDRVRRGFYNLTSTPTPEAEGYLVSAFTKNPEAVWEVIRFITSLEYQEGYVKGGFGISFLPEANRPENFSIPEMAMYAVSNMSRSLMRVIPSRTENMIRARQLMPGIYPTYYDVLDNVYLGKAGVETLKDLARRMDASLDEGIKRAQEEGFKVTRDDWVNPGWDSTKDWVPPKK